MKFGKNFLIIAGLIAIGILMGFGCAKKQITQETGAMPTSATSQQQATSQATPTPQTTPSSQPTSTAPQTSSAQTTPATPGAKNFDNVPIYFDFDQYDLRQSAVEKLQKKAEWLRNHPEAALLIEGHCDERGTNEYNIALGDRRADAALKYLNSFGIPDHRISTVSYGEERPADLGQNEEAWAKNRRDEFYLKKLQ